MENLQRLVIQIAYTPNQKLHNLSPIARSLLPLLSFASALYRFSLLVREQLYSWGVFRRKRLPVPVVSVGNLTWGGNGKTPMVEFIARLFDEAGICPLILTRGYAGGDEAKMLQRHLVGTSTKIGIGANRAITAAQFFKKYGYIDSCSISCFGKLNTVQMQPKTCDSLKIGAVILDDGMQHWSLLRNLEIVMVNGMMPWENSHLLPRGPLREPLISLTRADVAVIHHADLISDVQLGSLVIMMRDVKETLPIFFSRLVPSHFFEVKHRCTSLPLRAVDNMIVLCVSAISFADAFVETIRKIGALYVDRLDFNDHHFIQNKEIEMIRERLKKLQDGFNVKPVVVVTEKDYDRDSIIFTKLDHVDVLVLCSSLQIMPSMEYTVESFKNLLMKIHRSPLKMEGSLKIVN